MFWRVAVTAGIWFLGLSFVQWDGQVFHHSIAMLAAAIVGSLPWIRLAFSKPGTRGRVTAILIVALSAIAVVWIAFDLIPLDLAIQCRALDAENLSGAALVPVIGS